MNKYCLATIVNHEEITSGIWKMELAASEIARTAGPGQFIMLYPPDKRNLLTRPISLSAISEKSVTIVYRIAGKGTKQFSQLQKNDRIRIMGRTIGKWIYTTGPGNKKHCCWRWLGNSTTFRVV